MVTANHLRNSEPSRLSQTGISQRYGTFVPEVQRWVPGTFSIKLLPLWTDWMPFRYRFSYLKTSRIHSIPTTTIRFELPASQHVQLAVYSVAGQLIGTLVNEIRPAGVHEVRFDGRAAVIGSLYLPAACR